MPAMAAPPATAKQADAAIFTERARAAGLDFTHINGMSGEFYLAENLGGGGALFDYDNDGDLDLYVVQGHLLGPGKTWDDAVSKPRAGQPLSDRLYRNDLKVNADGTRVLHFTDVTVSSGITATGYGMGATAGDIDNDGWIDLYVTNLGDNQLWRNNGDGSFTDITAKAGVGEPRFSVSAAFLDIDRDGFLDLYVGNYVDFSPEKNKACYAPSSARDYCSPLMYAAFTDRLFRNRGDGSFEDVSAKARLAREPGSSLGVVVADFNNDAWPDIYVTNDGMPNHLWINQKDGTFQNEALLSGTAVNMEGKAEAGMGVDAGDFDGDGDLDLFMTHLIRETNTLYVNNGDGWFEDRTVSTGLASPSKAFTSFGTGWLDYDNDSWLDLFVANGDVNIILSLVRQGNPYPLHQKNQLFANQGNGTFKEVSEQAGEVFALSEVSRGAAFGDVDNDGDTDVLVFNNNGRLRLLVNEVGSRNRWLGLRLLDRSGRDALGARVELRRAKGSTLWRGARADGSYACANDPRVLLGLGATPAIRDARVHWPSGLVEERSDLRTDRYVTLREGEGKKVGKP